MKLKFPNIISIFSSYWNLSFVKNISYLSALQIFNLLIPLIIYPYLIRILGKETYGLIVYSQAVVTFISIFINFGFTMSATKFISTNRDNSRKLNEIFSNIIFLKGIILLLAMVFYFPIVISVYSILETQILFCLTVYLWLYEWLFPVWFFQGVEKMKYITIMNVVSRTIFVVFIFLFVKSSDDFLLYPILNGIAFLSTCILSLKILYKDFGVRLIKPSLKSLKFYFNDAYPIFLSNISSKIFSGSNKIIIGSFLTMTDVSYYDLAEKVTNLLKLPQAIITQAFFPKICKDRDVNFVLRVSKISLGINFAAYFLVVIFAQNIISFLAGVQMLDSYYVVLVLSITAPLIVLTTTFGTLILVTFGYNQEFSRGTFFSALFYLMITVLIYVIFGFTAVNLCIATVTTIMFEAIMYYIYCNKLKLLK